MCEIVNRRAKKRETAKLIFGLVANLPKGAASTTTPFYDRRPLRAKTSVSIARKIHCGSLVLTFAEVVGIRHRGGEVAKNEPLLFSCWAAKCISLGMTSILFICCLSVSFADLFPSRPLRTVMFLLRTLISEQKFSSHHQQSSYNLGVL
jgi:hypothetical protein